MVQATYEVRVSGTIPEELLAELGGLDVVVEPSETILYGSMPDQSALFGLIARIHGLGLRLIEVRRLAGSDAEPDRPPGRGAATAEEQSGIGEGGGSVIGPTPEDEATGD